MGFDERIRRLPPAYRQPPGKDPRIWARPARPDHSAKRSNMTLLVHPVCTVRHCTFEKVRLFADIPAADLRKRLSTRFVH